MTKVLERRAVQLAALGHPARLALLREIVQRGNGGTTTTDLQAKLDILVDDPEPPPRSPR